VTNNHNGNISWVPESDLCIHCGFCYSVCPVNALVWNKENKVPKINPEKCTNCGICTKVCPSIDISEYYFHIHKDFNSYLIGPIKKVFLAWSNDEKLRFESSSGGFITELLKTLMDLDIVTGACVVVPDHGQPFNPKVIKAKNKDDVERAKGSKYTIVSPGLILRDIMINKGRFAIVGLPCHILAFKKAEEIFKPLRDKIVLHIGLFCGHVMYPDAYKRIVLKETGKNPSLVKEVRYRGNGWPGYLTISFKDGKKIELPYDYWVQLYLSSFLFTPLRCFICNDSTAELADISVGDPWIDEIKRKEPLGVSLVVVRTKRGEDIINKLKKLGRIGLTPISPDYITKSQKTNITFKKIKIRYRIPFILKPNYWQSSYLHISSSILRYADEHVLEKLYSIAGARIVLWLNRNNKLSHLLFRAPRFLLKFYTLFVFMTNLNSMSIKAREVINDRS